MPTILKAGNLTTGGTFTPDSTGILEIRTGTGTGTTGMTIDASQNVTVAGTFTATGGSIGSIRTATAITTTTTSFTGATTGASTTLTASSVTGTIQVGQVIAGTNIAAGTVITALGSGTGGAGTYTISPASTGTVSGTITIVGVEFRNIPTGAERITVMFNGFSTNGTSSYLVQIGSGSITTSGYLSSSSVAGGTNVASSISSTAGFIIFSSLAANIIYGKLEILLLSGSTYLSTQTAGLNQSSVYYGYTGGGNVTLSGTLDRVRITTVNGTDTFDAGSINILIE
jgi:hypothetical protein